MRADNQPLAHLARPCFSASWQPAASTEKAGRRARSLSGAANGLLNAIGGLLDHTAERFIPATCSADPELGRRARLICRFGFLGAIFGAVYALFYISIQHIWGALVIVLCSTGFGFTPRLMRRTGSLEIAGNSLSLILILGFSALCFLEGGLMGHAIAWLASVPLCALLLLGRKGAGRWMIASFAACAGVAALNFIGVPMRPRYDPKWELVVTAAGYLGFILFMFLLGVIFETGRKRAFGKMQEALAQLEVSNAELKKLNQEKSEFLGMAAHDLKNPLGVIIGSAELLGLHLDEQKSARLRGNISAAAARMLQLVKNLLDANAIEESRFTSKIERFDLLALTRECLETHRTAATAKEIRLEQETDSACWALADRSATLQILDNLVSNAVKYSPRQTTVHARAEMTESVAIVTIRDEGPGIDEQDLKKMFGKFTRLSARPTGGESSNGFGLFIVKRLSEAMGGTVRCQSQLGEGATFILQLPVEKEVGQV
jgi:signal transduction histidine kinase